MSDDKAELIERAIYIYMQERLPYCGHPDSCHIRVPRQRTHMADIYIYMQPVRTGQPGEYAQGYMQSYIYERCVPAR